MKTETTTQTNSIQCWNTDDINEQSDLLSDWEQEYLQLSSGKFAGRITVARDAQVGVVGECSNLALQAVTVPPRGELIIGLQMQGQRTLEVNRRPLDYHSLLVLEGGREYEFRTRGEVELLGIRVSQDWLLERGENGQNAALRSAIRRGVVQLDSAGAGMLRNAWEHIARGVHGRHGWPGSDGLQGVIDRTWDKIMLALSLAQTASGTDRADRADGADEPVGQRPARVVRQAVQFMRQHLEHPICMADVCAVVHVSQRTLQYHFEHSLHMSPQQYLKVLRLNAAHSLLRSIAARSRTEHRREKIADIAARCGYDHASRFASEYRRQFGRLPSDTLRDSGERQSLALT